MLRFVRRATVVLLLGAYAVSAFAILGDKGRTPKHRSILTNRTLNITPGSFSLKTGYNYRGSQVVDPAKKGEYINLNTVVTYQKGNTTYIVPLKKKIYINTASAGITITH